MHNLFEETFPWFSKIHAYFLQSDRIRWNLKETSWGQKREVNEPTELFCFVRERTLPSKFVELPDSETKETNPFGTMIVIVYSFSISSQNIK